MIAVANLWSGQSWDLPDDEALWAWVHEHAPAALLCHPRTTDDLLALVNAMQNYTAERQGAPEADLPPAVAGLFTAAALLRGGLQHHIPGHRAAAVFFEGDPELAALAAAGVAPTEENREALRGLAAAGSLAKAEPSKFGVLDGDVSFSSFDGAPRLSDDVVAVTDAGKEVADKLQKAIQAGYYKPAHLDGKHSEGSWLVECADGTTIFLKPGSGNQSPAAGAREQSAGQAQREAGFWAVLNLAGLGAWAPRADLVEIDGRAYAALAWLGKGWEEIKDAYEKNPTWVRDALWPYLQDGTLHRLAAMDWILGQTDRGGQNILYNAGQFRLIDAGGALAGDGFDPQDPLTFTPWYLRIWASHDAAAWNALPPEERFMRLPLLDEGSARALGAFLTRLPAREVAGALNPYGVDWSAVVRRLLVLQRAIAPGAGALSDGDRADAAVNKAWTIGLEP